MSAPPYAPPRGYPPGDAQAGHPQPYRAGAPAIAGSMPASMVTALRLMYAGAAYTLVWAVGVIAVAANVKDYPVYASGSNHGLAGTAAFTVLVGHRGGRAVAPRRAGLPPGTARFPGRGHGAVRAVHAGRAQRGEQHASRASARPRR